MANWRFFYNCYTFNFINFKAFLLKKIVQYRVKSKSEILNAI